MKVQTIYPIGHAYGVAILLVAMQFNTVFLFKLSVFGAVNLLLFAFFLTAALTAIRDSVRSVNGPVDLIICVLFLLAGLSIGHKPKCFFFMALWAVLLLASDLRLKTGLVRQARSGAVFAAAIAGLAVSYPGKGGALFYLSLAGTLLLLCLIDYFVIPGGLPHEDKTYK